MKITKLNRRMDDLLFWKIILWGAPVLGGILTLFANYKINRIENEKKVIEKETQIALNVKDVSNYYIASENQSGGFTGVINNDISSLQEMEALKLLQTLKVAPQKYSIILDRLDLLEISKTHYLKFRELIFISEDLCNRNMGPDGSSAFADYRNRTTPFLLKHFTEELYEDQEVAWIFDLRSYLQNFSNKERLNCVDVLNKVVNVSDIQIHKYAIKSMLIDLCAYSPELIPSFVQVFGEEKIRIMNSLWTPQELSLVHGEYRDMLAAHKIIV